MVLIIFEESIFFEWFDKLRAFDGPLKVMAVRHVHYASTQYSSLDKSSIFYSNASLKL